MRWLANINKGLREDSPLCTNDKKRFIMVLEKMCDKYERLPPSYEIAGELEWTEENLIGSGGKADVWRGVYEGVQVAVKVLRVDLGMDLATLEKVDPRLPSSCTDESGTGVLPGSG